MTAKKWPMASPVNYTCAAPISAWDTGATRKLRKRRYHQMAGYDLEMWLSVGKAGSGSLIVKRHESSHSVNTISLLICSQQELIKVNALQVAPAELEAVLLEFDPVADAAAVGITLDGQEWPRAYITLKDEHKGKVTENDIHAFMKEKVAKHKQLVGGIQFVDEVPKLQSGKIKRALVKEWAKKDAQSMGGLKPKAKL